MKVKDRILFIKQNFKNTFDKIIIISGATASGKSNLAMELALEVNGVIVNADSLQIYKSLPTLSSQPSEEDKKLIDHRLYSYFDLKNCSLAKWCDIASQEIKKIFTCGKIPILVGGTGMYIKHLVNGISEIPEISVDNIAKSEKILEEVGIDFMYRDLCYNFPDMSKKISQNDKQRIVRNYQVFLETGKNIYNFHDMAAKKTYFPSNKFLHFHLNIEREVLYKNCNTRFKKMIKNGAIDEVKNLLNLQPDNSLNLLKTIGFNEISQYLQGVIDLDVAIETACQKTRNYAKRQITYFKHQFDDMIIL